MPDRLPFIVEPMTLDDVDQVMVIERLSFSAPWSARAYRFEIEKNEHGVMLVARRAPRSNAWPARLMRRLKLARHAPVLGYGGIWLLVDEAHVSTLAVHPEWRGRGLGDLLLLSLLEQGMKRQVQSATLEVRVSNQAAQALYLKCGFEIAGQQRRYYSDNNEDAFIMVTPRFGTPSFQDNLRQCRAQLVARLQTEA